MEYNVEIVDNAEPNYNFDFELELSGVSLKEELIYLINLCSRNKSEKGESFPLFILFNEERKFLGYFNLNYPNVLSLCLVSDNYRLNFINRKGDTTVAILDGDKNNICDSLCKLLQL